MKIGVLGTGQVGSAIAQKLASLGHDVMMGSRDPARKPTQPAGPRVGTQQQAAAHGEWVVNALPGEASLVALRDLDIDGKILVDIGNYNSAVDQPIVEPLGQAIQREHPKVRLVKTLNSVSAHLMVDPGHLGAPHSVFIASDDADARRAVAGLLQSFGWQDIIDLGDIGATRAMEQLIPLWMRLEEHFDGQNFNLAVIRS